MMEKPYAASPFVEVTYVNLSGTSPSPPIHLRKEGNAVLLTNGVWILQSLQTLSQGSYHSWASTPSRVKNKIRQCSSGQRIPTERARMVSIEPGSMASPCDGPDLHTSTRRVVLDHIGTSNVGRFDDEVTDHQRGVNPSTRTSRVSSSNAARGLPTSGETNMTFGVLTEQLNTESNGYMGMRFQRVRSQPVHGTKSSAAV
ncbi:uncharacterized protein BDZ83DRAFT_23866 [Colletotrichum acutatum]|uniref:Uncharacterized protein n=1 Tax=Glomerella acutata TaxID=27357 RepID=A0AAD8XAW8_GLOAC|nr:uncharacterized protein BDZ83DRAFT_23866 [Colletotrichum acutatum]KAK1717497.1 hypothetical protein BDZ83DRAFT_23866 [Colletotrichum acutatum]